MAARILIADDESSVRQLLQTILEEHGYQVIAATNGDELVRKAQQQPPDLIVVDLMMPVLDGYEAIRQLRNDTRTSHLPVVILTARNTPNDVVSGFETGADDFISKPFDARELLARIRYQLRNAARLPVRNPLTGLNGNVLLTEELKYRLQSSEPFAYLYADMDNFKAFNDTYGVARGDRLIKQVADVMVESVHNQGTGSDFLGHIGGDDFAVITTPDYIDTLSNAILKLFDERVRELYDPADLERGYLIGHDRQGVLRRFPIVSLSIGIVTNVQRQFDNYEEISRLAAEMKQYAKQQPHSSYAVDDRVQYDLSRDKERRGNAVSVLCVGTTRELVERWCDLLREQGYRVLVGHDLVTAHALLAHSFGVSIVLLESALGEAIMEITNSLRRSQHIAVIVISSAPDAPDYQQIVTKVLPYPVSEADLLAAVAHLSHREA